MSFVEIPDEKKSDQNFGKKQIYQIRPDGDIQTHKIGTFVPPDVRRFILLGLVLEID